MDTYRGTCKEHPKGPKATPLDPWGLYNRESVLVLKTVAKFLSRGVAPTAEMICKLKTWHPDGVKRYLLDQVESGYLRPTPGRAFTLTPLGSKALGIEHLEPILPTQVKLRYKAIAQAQIMAQQLKDPSILEAFKQVLGRKPKLSELQELVEDTDENTEETETSES